MASSTSTMEVDEGGKKAEEDDISSKAKKYVAEKRKLAGAGGATVGKEVQLLCPLGPAHPVLFLKSKPTRSGRQTLTVRTRQR